MRLSTLLGASVLSVAVPLIALADHGHGPSRRHHDVALAARDGGIHKRFDNARFTFYDITTGQVACEGYYSASDFVVALNADQYGGYWKSDYCFQTITISYGGKSTQAKVVDECPGCPYGGLDLTQGLFEYFASTDKGVLYGEWSFGSSGGNGGGNSDPTTTTKKATPKTTWQPEPTTTWQPPTTWWQPETTSTTKTSKKHTTTSTSTSTTPSSTSTTHTTTSTTPTTSSVPSTSSTHSTTSTKPTSSAAPTPSVNLSGAAAGLAALPTGIVEVSSAHPHNLNQANWALVNFGSLVETAN